MTISPPLPEVSRESAWFWSGGEQGQLLIHRCRSCTNWFHPPAPACHRCRSTDVGPEPVSGRAQVAAYTVNEHAWHPAFPPPYVVAIVELEEDSSVRLTTNVVGYDCSAVHIGMGVEVHFKLVEDTWIPIFMPVEV